MLIHAKENRQLLTIFLALILLLSSAPLVSAVSYVDLERISIGELSGSWLNGLNDWEYRLNHTISNSTGAGQNYQVKIKTYYGFGSENDLELALLNFTDVWSSHGLTWGENLSLIDTDVATCYDPATLNFYMSFAEGNPIGEQSLIVKLNSSGGVVASNYYDNKTYLNIVIANEGKLYAVESAGDTHNSTLDELSTTDLSFVQNIVTFNSDNFSRTMGVCKVNDTVLCLVGGHATGFDESFYMKVDLSAKTYTMFPSVDGMIFTIFKNGDYGYMDHYGDFYGNKKVYFPTWTASAMGEQPATKYDLIPLFLYDGRVLHGGGGDGDDDDYQLAYWYRVSDEYWSQLDPYPDNDKAPSIWSGVWFPQVNKSLTFRGSNRYFNTPATQWVYDAESNTWDEITGRFTELYGKPLGATDSMYGYGTIGNNETFGQHPCGFLSAGYYRFVATFTYRWYDSGEKAIRVPVFGKIAQGSSFNFGEGNCSVYLENKSRSDFGDIRFVDDDGTTHLDYWMIEKVDGFYATFMVEIGDSLSTAAQFIYIYYGNTDATTTSDIYNTMLAYYNFTSNTTDEWQLEYYRYAGGGSGGKIEPPIWDEGQGHIAPSMKMDCDYYGAGGTGYIFLFTQPIKKGIGSELAFLTDFRAYSSTYLSSVTNNHLYVYKNVTITSNADQLWDEVLWQGSVTDTGWRDLVYDRCSTGTSAYDDVKICVGGIDAWSTNYYQQRWWDDYIVRKYVDPEPQHNGWGNQQNKSYVYPQNLTVSNLISGYVVKLYNGTYKVCNATTNSEGGALLQLPAAYRLEKFEGSFRVYDDNGSFLYSKWFEDVAGGDAYLIKEEINILSVAIIGLFVLIPVFLGVIVFLRRKR